MGLLDDLEQAANRRKQEQDEQSRLKEQRELLFRTELDPAMQALQDFLGRLIQPLTALKPERIVQYELPGYGTLVAQVVHEYQLGGQATSTMREITLRFVAILLSDRCPLIEANGATRVKTVASALQKVHLGGIMNPRKDHSGEVVEASFRAKGKIPLTAHFVADAASGQLRATFSNFEDLSTFTKVYAPAQFNQELFEVFARYITREDDVLTREAIPDKVRQSLRTKVQQEEIRRKFEERMYQKAQEEQREREEAANLGLRIKKQGGALFDKLKSGVSGLIDKLTKK
jgi:hypothetical protein